MLLHADNGGVDHLDRSIMGSGKCVYDAAPHTGPPPADEPFVASGVGPNATGRSRQGAPDRRTPEDAIEDTSVVNPRNATRLVRQHLLYRGPLVVCKLVTHDSSPDLAV